VTAIVLIRGAGDLASGVAVRLHRAGLNIVMTELQRPVAVRLTVSFAEAIFHVQTTVEDIVGQMVADPTNTAMIMDVLASRQVALLVDPDGLAARALNPMAIVDGRMMKKPPEAFQHSALLYIGLGPGFIASVNCDAVVETQRGHTLGRPIWHGAALNDTAVPEGDERRILRAPVDGVVESINPIGQRLEKGAVIAAIGGVVITAPFAGILRGLIQPGTLAVKGMKIGDLDARGDPRLCELVSDKSLAVGGGVLEALCTKPEVRSKLWA
jgi:xanthine dehydrogenase accessory factor